MMNTFSHIYHSLYNNSTSFPKKLGIKDHIWLQIFQIVIQVLWAENKELDGMGLTFKKGFKSQLRSLV